MNWINWKEKFHLIKSGVDFHSLHRYFSCYRNHQSLIRKVGRIISNKFIMVLERGMEHCDKCETNYMSATN